MLLAEGWNSPRATVCMHLAPTASRRVYQQRIGRIMRIHPRKEAGVVVDFVPKGATHSERVVSLHALLDSDFYREGARVTPAPRRRQQRRARRKLSPVPWLVPVTPDVARRLAVIQREWQRIDPKYLDDDEQRFWATIAGRQIRFDQRAEFAQEVRRGSRRQGRARAVPRDVRRREPESSPADDGAHGSRRDADRPRRLRRPRHARHAGAAVGEGPRGRRPDPPPRGRRGEAARARSDPRALDVAARPRDAQGAGSRASRPSSPRRSGCSAPPRTRAATGTRRTSNRLVQVAHEMPLPVGAALLASADGYTPRANGALDHAREELGTIARDRERARRQPPGAEAHGPQVAPAAAQAQGRHGRGRPSAAGRRDGRDRPRRRAELASRAGDVDETPRRRRLARPARLRTSSSSASRSRRNRVISAASASPDGRSSDSSRVERVGAPLELLDVGGRLGVGGDRLRDLLGVLARRLGELGHVDLRRRARRRAARRAPSRPAGSARAET